MRLSDPPAAASPAEAEDAYRKVCRDLGARPNPAVLRRLRPPD